MKYDINFDAPDAHFESTEVLSYWAVETLGDLKSTSRGLNPGVKM
jgi:hypothetical protein